MSSVKGLSEICTHHIPPTNVSSGFLQSELVHRPSLPDTIKSDVAFYWDDFLNDYYDTIKHQATVFFDSIIATKTQYYTYYYYSPYNQIENIDSLFVLLPDHVVIPPKEDPQIPQPGIVNLVIIDEKGITKFEVLNINDYDNIEVYLFSAQGKKIYSSLSYKNDFDMSSLSGTYYYKMLLQSDREYMTIKGFVQVINTYKQ